MAAKQVQACRAPSGVIRSAFIAPPVLHEVGNKREILIARSIKHLR